MIHIKFTHLEKSDLVIDAVQQRFEGLIEKFPDLKKSKVEVTLSMDHSRNHAGPELFHVKLYIGGGRYSDVTISKTDNNLYVAVADVVHNALEVLNRYGDRHRVKQHRRARAAKREMIEFATAPAPAEF